MPPRDAEVSAAMDHGLPLPRRVRAIVSVSAGSVLYTLDANIANIALPSIANGLHVTTATAVLLVSAYNLVLAMVLLPLAAIADRIGYRRVYVGGLLCYLLTGVACYAAGSFSALLAARAVQSLAAAAVLSTSLAMLRVIYPMSHLGRGLGLNTIAASSGAAIAPALGGWILSVASWHWVFTVGAPLALLALSLAGSLPVSDHRRERYDSAGALLCALTFGLLIFGFQALSQGGSPLIVGGSIVLGAAVAVAFVRHERTVALPVLPVDLLAKPTIALSVAAALCAVLASTGLLLYLPLRLSALGIGTAAIGAMIAPNAVAVTVTAPTAGMLSDRISPSVLGTIGLTIGLASAIALAWLPDNPGYVDVAWRAVLCGIGFAMFFSPNGRLIIGSVPHHRAAGASSLVATTRMFGQALGSAGVGAILALHGRAAAPAFAAAGLVVIGLICSAARIVVPEPRETT